MAIFPQRSRVDLVVSFTQRKADSVSRRVCSPISSPSPSPSGREERYLPPCTNASPAVAWNRNLRLWLNVDLVEVTPSEMKGYEGE